VKPAPFGLIELLLFLTGRYPVWSAANVSTVNAAYRHHESDGSNDGFLMVTDSLTWRMRKLLTAGR
jgi:hypothetical protein